MLVKSETIQALNTSLMGTFKNAFEKQTPLFKKIATEVASKNKSNTYGWLKDIPGIREWIGDRHVQNVSEGDYTIKNRKFEGTIGVKKDDLEDDELGHYTVIVEELAQQAAMFPDKLVFELLKKGKENKCFDGQYFFDTDHEVNGASVSNYTSGSGAAWYLLNCGRALKPFIYQSRTKPNFVALDKETDVDMFKSGTALYGVDFRGAAGYAFWQMAHCSEEDLTDANFNKVYAAMCSIKTSTGETLRNKPTTLVVPPSLRDKAFAIVNSEKLANGTNNPNKGIVEVIDASELA